MDADGKVLNHASVPTEPNGITDYLAQEAPNAERVVHESGILATWLTRELERRDVLITCICARMVHKALSARLNKSDKADAEGMAQLARTGWFMKVHIHSEASDWVRALVAARERLIRMRKDLEAHIRGVLKTFGIRMAPVLRAHCRQGFRDQLAEAGASNPMLELLAQTMIPNHYTPCASAEALAQEPMHYAKQNTLARRLMTGPGVCPLVALNFIATADDASRFRRSADVGAFLGLTPRRYQSGEIDKSGQISKSGPKCGHAEMRRLLVSAATSLMTQVRR